MFFNFLYPCPMGTGIMYDVRLFWFLLYFLENTAVITLVMIYAVNIANISKLQLRPRIIVAIAKIATNARNENLALLSAHLRDLNLNENIGISQTSR